MFAGPNGSGKSTLKRQITSIIGDQLIGIYINADDIERSLRVDGRLSLDDYQLTSTTDELNDHLHQSGVLRQSQSAVPLPAVSVRDGFIHISSMPKLSYVAAAIAEFIRKRLMDMKWSFSFETAMSHPSKCELLQHGQQLGYRTYLYYVATADPLINISRVKVRVLQGGHNVPEDKIRDRYARSLSLLLDAMKNSHRAYIFDNSNDHERIKWLAELNDDSELEIKAQLIPAWFQHAVWNKLPTSANPQ